MSDVLLVLNCGSSSIKFALFDAGSPVVPRLPLWRGAVDGIGTGQPRYRDGDWTDAVALSDAPGAYHAALAFIRERVVARLGASRLVAVAHRVVHGGSRYFSPVRVDADVLADLTSYVPLAPLHQPFALEAIGTLLQAQPRLAQVACFDTAFHRTMPLVEKILPLSWSAWQDGLRRYGFHGLSYEYVAGALAERHGDRARGRTIVAHLGSGASLCAMRDLSSVATTMGFSSLDGLMMGTRCGALDPGAILYLMQTRQLGLDDVSRVLYHESGLLGVSGVSSDPRELLGQESRDDETGARVRAALDLYVRRIVREIGALTAVLGGLDVLAFTAGVGEHNPEIRRRICSDLTYLGLAVDDVANAANHTTISPAGAPVTVAVEPTNEEWMAATHATALLRDASQS